MGKPIFGSFVYVPFWAEVFQAIKEKGHCETYRIFYATKLTHQQTVQGSMFSLV